MKIVMHQFIVLVALAIIPGWADDGSGVDSLRKAGKIFSTVAAKVSPAVVMIKVEKEVLQSGIEPRQMPFDDLFGDDFFRRFFGQPYRRSPQPQPRRTPQRKYRTSGQGSGFIISADGYILTNNHVVGGADVVKVSLNDGREFKAKIVGTDPRSDVAVIKIEGKNLPVLPLGNSDELEVGEWVLAVGNPFGLSHTLTAGIVSAKGRNRVGITDYEDFIQTDAAINPGNSGGPLVNLDGKAVGINTAIFSRSGGYMGIGFAIPINMVKVIKNQLIRDGSVKRGFLGVIIQPLSSDLVEEFGVKKGIVVSQVQADSAADKAGIKAGDVIVEMDKKDVGEVGKFRNRVSLLRPGSEHRVVVIRNGRKKELKVKIGTLPNPDGGIPGSTESDADDFGFAVGPATKEQLSRYGLDGKKGVLITSVTPRSIAAEAGLTPGLLIRQVNRKDIDSVADFRKAIGKSSKRALLLVEDRQGARYVVLKK